MNQGLAAGIIGKTEVTNGACQPCANKYVFRKIGVTSDELGMWFSFQNRQRIRMHTQRGRHAATKVLRVGPAFQPDIVSPNLRQTIAPVRLESLTYARRGPGKFVQKNQTFDIICTVDFEC